MASRTPPIDPRLTRTPEPAEEGAETSVRPVVALPRSGPSAAVLVLVAVAAAILLFVLLESRRRTQLEPATRARGSETAVVAAAPPPLYIPPAAPPPAVLIPAPAGPVSVLPQPRAATSAPEPAPPPQPVIRYVPQPQVPAPVSYPAAPQRQSNSPTLVLDNTQGSQSPPGAAPGGDRGSLVDTFEGRDAVSRVRSGLFANRSTTVAQGTLVPAVLETAFDSRRPGFARAIVSRDVRGFDGTRVLIPRGSRLTGEYKSDIQPGQKRALINWTRLIRPDGVTIALGSPAADTLGRGGVKGNYDSHFFERFAGAILQTALEVGANLGTRAAGNNVIIGLPGSTQNLAPLLQTTRSIPTLTVPAGTSISVFVARDLDFTSSEKER